MARTAQPQALQQDYEKYYSDKTRDKMDDSDFAGPHQSFPILTQDDVHNAARLIGHADNPDAVKAAIKRIAKRKGFSLPDTWKDDGDQDESSAESAVLVSNTPSTTPVAASPHRPKSRIATIRVCWIEDDARSLNGRIYPRETVDRLIASGQRKIADPNGLPITCFLSHADADRDHTPALIGKAIRIWREGAKGMALIDIADTSHARDALALIIGKYIHTESLRASNAELRTDSRYDVAVVGGDNIELDGIDLTNYPGLEQCARIQQVQIAESAHHSNPLTEVFDIASQAVAIHEVHSQKEKSMSEQLTTEADQGGNTVGGYSPTSGEAPYMTTDPTQDSYGQRMYKAPDLENPDTMQGMQPAPELMEAHDRIAMVQGRSCVPGKESARWKSAYHTLSEADKTWLKERGKALSSKNDAHLDAAHDALAKHAGMACEGINNKTDPDNDGDDDSTDNRQQNPDFALDKLDNDMESTKNTKKGTRPMSKEEALKLLEAQGYDVQLQRKKTEADLLREQMEAMKAENAKQLEDMRKMITESQDQMQYGQGQPQRKSQVLGSNVGNNNTPQRQIPLRGRHLQEQISKLDWEELADPTCPLPENIPLDLLMKEFEHYYAVQYDDKHGMLSATM